jgi:hypothetical protein
MSWGRSGGPHARPAVPHGDRDHPGDTRAQRQQCQNHDDSALEELDCGGIRVIGPGRLELNHTGVTVIPRGSYEPMK